MKMLARGLEHIRSVPYKVSLRWLFYRLLQDGIFTEKTDYKDFVNRLAYYRGGFKQGWRPDSLVDDTRITTYEGWGYLDRAEAIAAMADNPDLELSHFVHQQKYVEVWYEAEAMSRQFQHYCRGVTLRPFKGDMTLEPKWRIAHDLNTALARFKKPIHILYFGDRDSKGDQIPVSAVKDIRTYCRQDGYAREDLGRWADRFEFTVGGLTVAQAKRLGNRIRRNPDKPGEYQWEALTDEDAGEIITTALNALVDPEIIKATEAETEALNDEVGTHLKSLLGGAE